MMLMSLGVKQGDTVTVSQLDGADEDAAIAALKEFFEDKSVIHRNTHIHYVCRYELGGSKNAVFSGEICI